MGDGLLTEPLMGDGRTPLMGDGLLTEPLMGDGLLTEPY
jgi:hypothetical protein